MRWVVMLLLLANVGYAGWHLLAVEAKRPAAVVRSPTADNLERLWLLEEVEAARSACMEAGPFAAEEGFEASPEGRESNDRFGAAADPTLTEKLCETIAP